MSGAFGPLDPLICGRHIRAAPIVPIYLNSRDLD